MWLSASTERGKARGSTTQATLTMTQCQLAGLQHPSLLFRHGLTTPMSGTDVQAYAFLTSVKCWCSHSMSRMALPRLMPS